MTNVRITNSDEAIALIGNSRLARLKALIQRRQPRAEIEVVETMWGEKDARLGEDYVTVEDGKIVDTCKITDFEKKMKPVNGTEFFRDETPYRLIEVPDGMVVECVALVGREPCKITAPDFVAIEAESVCAFTRKTFDRLFEWS